MSSRLPQAFYQRQTATVARDLLGKVLCFQKNENKNEIMRGRIVETEAYLGIQDRACHTYGGRKTPRVQSMYLPGGHSYIYMIYGLHFCLNVVTRNEKHPEAVLIRALSPIHPVNLKTNGPGRLCASFGLSKKQDGFNLYDAASPLWIEKDLYSLKKSMIARGPRIGIDYAEDAVGWPLRFWIKDHPDVSR